MSKLMVFSYIGIYLGTQIIANVIMKYCASDNKLFWWGIALAHIVFSSLSVIAIMLAYRGMNQNIVFGIASGGSFLAVQLVFLLLWGSHINLLQVGAMILVTAGLALFGIAGVLE